MKIKEGGVMDIQKNRKEHVLKTDPAVFQDVLDGKKTFEIRFNDRGYQVGDLIVLKETKFTGQQMREGSPLIYTGREMQKQISYILSGYGLQDGWVILGIQDIKATKAQAVPEWIRMEDKYPKAGESVLICINGIRQNIAYFYDCSASDEYSTGHDWFDPVFTGGETEDECVVKTEDVTHWMLLPQEPAND